MELMPVIIDCFRVCTAFASLSPQLQTLSCLEQKLKIIDFYLSIPETRPDHRLFVEFC